MNKSVTGIDISRNSIKAVVLKIVKQDIQLIDYKELIISSAEELNNLEQELQIIVKKLKQLKKALPFFSHNVALAVADNAVISKQIQIPKTSQAFEKKHLIHQAFSQHSPFPIDELNIDYVPIKSSSTSLMDAENYQVYAAKKAAINFRIKALKKAGFSPFLVELNAHALVALWQKANALSPLNKNVLIHIDAEQTLICCDRAKDTPLIKQLPLSPNTPASEPPSELSFAPEVFSSALAEQVMRTLSIDFYAHLKAPIEQILLTTSVDLPAQFIIDLQKHLNLPCVFLDPLTLIKTKRLDFEFQVRTHMKYSLACGLALRGLSWQGLNHVA